MIPCAVRKSEVIMVLDEITQLLAKQCQTTYRVFTKLHHLPAIFNFIFPNAFPQFECERVSLLEVSAWLGLMTD